MLILVTDTVMEINGQKRKDCYVAPRNDAV